MEFLAVFFVLSVMAAFFIFIGILLVKIIPDNMDKKQLRCTEAVLARIVDMRKDSSSDSGNMYAPVYEFWFNGVLYRKSPNVYTSKKPVVGADIKLLVDPNNVDVYVDPERNKQIKKVLNIVGVGMLSVSMVMVYIVLWRLHMELNIWIIEKVIEAIYNLFQSNINFGY